MNLSSSTEGSVDDASSLQKVNQSLVSIPVKTTYDPLLTVPVHKRIWRSEKSSSDSVILHICWTSLPLFICIGWPPSKGFPTINDRTKSTPKTY